MSDKKIELKTEQKVEQKPQDKQIEQLKHELDVKTKFVEDYTDHLKRLQAEFDNYVKRVDKEKKEFQQYASEKLILRLLVIIDEFKLALEEFHKNKDLPKEFVKGTELIFNNLHKVLQDEGVKEIDAKGRALDPYKHEVVLQINSDEYPEDTVVDELQKGYMLKDKVLRYAKVKISKPKTNQTK